MGKSATKLLKPRKEPIQERAGVTVQSIWEATIQVLLKDGMKRLTTTRIAERAGVSVGTLYQYYPNKQSVLLAVLEEHLGSIASVVNATCEQMRGRPVDKMMDGLIEAYVDAKMKHVDVSKALYAISSELNAAPAVKNIMQRVESNLIAMLSTAPGARDEKLPFIAMILFSSMAASSKAVVERGATPDMVNELKRSLKVLSVAYLEKEFTA